MEVSGESAAAWIQGRVLVVLAMKKQGRQADARFRSEREVSGQRHSLRPNAPGNFLVENVYIEYVYDNLQCVPVSVHVLACISH